MKLRDGVKAAAGYGGVNQIYRYWLIREWQVGRKMLFIMLNPSTATEEVDDPTVRRCQDVAKIMGYGGIVVCNLFAYRATDPKEMKKAFDPVGPDNDMTLMAEAKRAQEEEALVVAAWGTHSTFRSRGASVTQMLTSAGVTLHCLGETTRAGHPRHPLYTPANAGLDVWRQSLIVPRDSA